MIKQTLMFTSEATLTFKNQQMVISIKESDDTITRPIEDIGFVIIDNPMVKVSMPLLNALAGIAAGYALGMNDEEIKAGIEALVPLAGRNNLIETDSLTIIDDCYNANPASMKSSLDVLAYADTRKVAILGDMGELGADELAMHREVGAYAAFKNTDVLVCIGALSKDMAEAAKETVLATEKNMKVFHFDTKEDFYLNMGQILNENDTILVKASHFMEFPEIVKKLSEEA